MDDRLSKKFYRIRDVSEMLGVNQSTLRFWEREFSELKPSRNPGGIRLYTPKDIELLRLISFLLKEKGLKIEAAKDYIRKNKHDVDRRMHTIEKLKAIRSRLNDVLVALDGRQKK